MQIEKYFKQIENQVRAVYSMAEEARARGLDPKAKVEIPLAKSLTERAIGLISVKYPQINNPKLINRISALEKEYGKLDPAVCLIIEEEIAKEKFCKFKNLLEGIDAGIRFAFAYYTLGVVVPPLEGFTHFELKKTKEGKDYFCAYFSGPIRAAGTTAEAFSLLLIDYLRYKFGYAKYDPMEVEIKRGVTEIYDFHERIANLQYLAKEEEITFLLKNLPIQVDGLPSENKEVSNYKDLKRIETNRLRNGFCLVMSEGIAQKAAKLLRFITKLKKQGFELPDWDFLEKYIALHHKLEEKSKQEASSAVYIKDLVAGRPVLGHPSRPGGFRLRYGKTRGNGFSAMAIHPATMEITDRFIAIGTQIKTEKPTKGAALCSCDSMDGPIVLLTNGNVIKVKTVEQAKSLSSNVKEIIHLGDILIPYADFLNRNAQLELPGYVEEYWNSELRKKSSLNINPYEVNFNQAVELSETCEVPLHPTFIFYWNQITKDDFLGLLDWLSNGKCNGKLILPYGKTEQERFQKGKRALEILGIEHEVAIENVVFSKDNSKALFVNLGLEADLIDKENYLIEKEIQEVSKKIKDKLNEESIILLDIINLLSKYKIKDKSGTYVGARMGRPEKAKLRKLTGSPNVLFPIGEEGGRLRSVQAAVEFGTVKSDFPLYKCLKCNKETIYPTCELCGQETSLLNFCPTCKQTFMSETCPEHGIKQRFSQRKIDIKNYFDAAITNLGLEKDEIPPLIKGVRGTTSEDHIIENLAKGFLRAIFNLAVNKDGTIRYDATELPLTHFRPMEIGTSIEDLRELGYTLDKDGKDLKSEDQILEIMPHDVILPSCPSSPDEPADKVFLRVANFIDSLLIRYYGLKPFYNIRESKDLIGHLIACMAPHNAAGVIGRIIGFSKNQALLASPYMHAAMRRDADGDEAAVMLLLDCLINFSKEYLPSHRGATQDAPLVLSMKINPGEVDDQIFDFDINKEIPLELYQAAEKGEHSSSVRKYMELIKDRVDKDLPCFKGLHYTHETSDINYGVICSAYKSLPTMQEKVQGQMLLAEKIRAVDTADVARLVIDRHFIRDIKGNLRKFSTQEFRCVKCNTKYRRPPLQGNCVRCNGRIIFTISEGSIIKYLEPAIQLTENYAVPAYIKQDIELTKRYIETIFGRETEKQEALQKWF